MSCKKVKRDNQMKSAQDKAYDRKTSENRYAPNIHMTWIGVIAAFLAGVLVFFLAKYGIN